jgi:AbrB family looped-hinge helix DNA binding protein
VITKLSTKGQVVIPQALRERKNLRPGDILEIEETAQGIFFRKRSKTRPQLADKSGSRIFQAGKEAPPITNAMVQTATNEIP